MKRVVSVVALCASALLGSTSVRAADVEVIHWWTSGGEQAAVSVFAREFDALGGDKWVDTALPAVIMRVLRPCSASLVAILRAPPSLTRVVNMRN